MNRSNSIVRNMGIILLIMYIYAVVILIIPVASLKACYEEGMTKWILSKNYGNIWITLSRLTFGLSSITAVILCILWFVWFPKWDTPKRSRILWYSFIAGVVFTICTLTSAYILIDCWINNGRGISIVPYSSYLALPVAAFGTLWSWVYYIIHYQTLSSE